jgi:hypothetical protein
MGAAMFAGFARASVLRRAELSRRQRALTGALKLYYDAVIGAFAMRSPC